jgi:class 3 adenylate cyclase
MRLIRNSALGIGVVSGVVFYTLIRFVQQVMPPWLALDLIVALGGGLALGIGCYLLLKFILRRIARRFREAAVPLLDDLPPTSMNELEELNQIYERVVAELALQQTQGAGADAKDDRLLPATDDRAPRDARGWLASETPSAHEVVAVVADLRGFTSASERLAAEVVVQEVLDIYVQAMIEAIERHEGTADTSAGDRVLAIFGYPRRRPDDASHAVGAALAMRQAAAQLRVRWRARLGIDIGIGIGIASGHVVVGAIGAPDRRDPRVIGDAVNLAIRLQGLARAGEVLAAAEVVESIDGADASFDLEALQPLPIKGKAAPQQIYRIAEPAVALVARAARAAQ